MRRTQVPMRLAATALICAGAVTAAATTKPSPPAPHVAAPAPHPAMPSAPRPAPSQQFGAPGGHPTGPEAVHHGMVADRVTPARPNAEPGRSPQPGRYAASSSHPNATGAHPAGTHAAFSRPGAPHVESAHTGDRPGEHLGARPGEHQGFGRPGEAGRPEEARSASGRVLAADDPARAHGRFDEHVRSPERERDIARLHGQDFHVRDVRYFNDREWHDWRGGYWHHDYYDGRFGWWFDVGGVYYPYAAPIFPFPLVVAPLVFDDVPAAPPPPEGFVPLPPLPQAAYHCADPNGFYPALQSCGSGWTVLAAH